MKNIFIYVIIITLTILMTKFFYKIKTFFLNKYKVLRGYWFIPFIILIISIIGNYINYKYNPLHFKNIKEGTDFINFYFGLFFAIYTGHYGFKQLEYSRYEKLLEEALTNLRGGFYPRAKDLYEEALNIKPKDRSVLANLSELALIINDSKLFFDKLYILEKISYENEKLSCKYLIVSYYLLEEDIGKAKLKIKDLLSFVSDYPNTIQEFNWDFSDLINSERYKALKGESKDLLLITIDLLKKIVGKREELLKKIT